MCIHTQNMFIHTLRIRIVFAYPHENAKTKEIQQNPLRSMLHARSTRKREVGVFKILHCRVPFLKKYVFGDRFHLIRVEGRPNHPEKQYPCSNKHGYVWTGPNLQTNRYVAPQTSSYCPVYSSLHSMAVLSIALLKLQKLRKAHANERRSREKNNNSCSRPRLLAVSLPQPAFVTLRAQPKPPCYAGQVYRILVNCALFTTSYSNSQKPKASLIISWWN